MKIHQIRNATLIVDFAGSTFLVDPVLARKGAYPGFANTPNSELAWPTVELPRSVDEIVDVDAVIVTHTHADHWDEAAKSLIPKELPVFVQHERDAAIVKASGFTDVRLLGADSRFGDTTLVKTPGQHGSDEAIEAHTDRLGEVSGVVFKHPSEKTLYVAGDTVWNTFVAETLEAHRPEVVVLNSGDAQIDKFGPIIMGKEDVLSVHRAAPGATLIASHMEAVNHATLTRAELRSFAVEHGMIDSLCIPEDGEIVTV